MWVVALAYGRLIWRSMYALRWFWFPSASRLIKLLLAVNTPWQRYSFNPHGSMISLKAVQVIGIDLSKIQPDVFVHHVSNSRMDPS